MAALEMKLISINDGDVQVYELVNILSIHRKVGTPWSNSHFGSIRSKKIED